MTEYNNQLMLQRASKINLEGCSQQEQLIYGSNFTPRIKDFEPKDFERLVDIVTKWRYYLGIKEVITEKEMALNVSFIKEEYPNFTIEMIDNAIKTSLKGLLGIDVKPYGAFSPLYISSVLNAYKRYNDKVVTDVIKKSISSEKPVERTPEQKRLDRIEYLNWYKDTIQTADFLKDFKNIMHSFLIKEGFLQEGHTFVQWNEAERIVDKIRFKEKEQTIKTSVTIEDAVVFLQNKEILTTKEIDFNKYEFN